MLLFMAKRIRVRVYCSATTVILKQNLVHSVVHFNNEQQHINSPTGTKNDNHCTICGLGPRVSGHLALFCIHCMNLAVTSWTCYGTL